MGPHQRVLLKSQLRHLEFVEQEVAQLDQEVAIRMAPIEDALQRLDEIPGVGRRVTEEVLAETGVDMGRFPTAAHLASWARVCPGNNESAGKRKSGATGHGNPWLRSTLVEAAWGAARTKGTYLAAQYHRLAARRGAKWAILALAHTILRTTYYLLCRGTRYQDLGGNYFEERDSRKVLQWAVRRIENLGYKVNLEAA